MKNTIYSLLIFAFVSLSFISCNTNTHIDSLAAVEISQISIDSSFFKKAKNSEKETTKFIPPIIKEETIICCDPENHGDPIWIETENLGSILKPYTVVEFMPQYPEGEATMMEFIEKNLRYPESARQSCVQGRVVLRFTVTETGALEDIHILRSLEPDFDKEAIRVIKLMPKWIPGKQNNKPVSVYYTLPVRFKL